MKNISQKAFFIYTSIIVLGIISVYLVNYVSQQIFIKRYTKDIEYIKTQIATDYPQINNKNISDYDKAILIRQWVATYIPWGSNSTVDNSVSNDINVTRMLETIKEREISMNCGGVSNVLMRLYELYGYEATTYHAGSLDSFNHVFTVVKIPYKGREILSIQDASYDVTYVNSQGEPYDFYDFLKAVKSEQFNNILIQSGNAKAHPYICNPQDTCNTPDLSNTIKSTELGNRVYLEKFNTNNLEKNKHIYGIYRGSFPEYKLGTVLDETKILEIIQSKEYNKLLL